MMRRRLVVSDFWHQIRNQEKNLVQIRSKYPCVKFSLEMVYTLTSGSKPLDWLLYLAVWTEDCLVWMNLSDLFLTSDDSKSSYHIFYLSDLELILFSGIFSQWPRIDRIWSDMPTSSECTHWWCIAVILYLSMKLSYPSSAVILVVFNKIISKYWWKQFNCKRRFQTIRFIETFLHPECKHYIHKFLLTTMVPYFGKFLANKMKLFNIKSPTLLFQQHFCDKIWWQLKLVADKIFALIIILKDWYRTFQTYACL